jgi:hypothetical protein
LAKNRPACSSPRRLPPSRRKHTVLRATIRSRIAPPLYRGADPRMIQATIPSRLLFSGCRDGTNRTRAASGKSFLDRYGSEYYLHAPAAFARACVDGPLDAREKSRNLTTGSIAVMCPACWRGVMAAGPDGFRDPAPNKLAASKAVAPDGFSGSSVRPMVISFSFRTLASTHGSGGNRTIPVCPATRHRGPCRTSGSKCV